MTAIRDPAAFAALVGTPCEVQSRLGEYKAEQVIVLPVARADAQHARQVAQTLTSIVALADAMLREQTLKALVGPLQPSPSTKTSYAVPR
jgi:hypothetical protein